MEQFLIFYAPFILIVAAIALAFWVARDDRAVKESDKG